MRLFIAIPLNAAMRTSAVDAMAAFRRGKVRGNYAKPENLHVTLAFIGEYPDPEAVLEVVRGVPFTPFDIALEGVGAFGDLWWLGLKRSEPLEAYVRRLRRALAEAGIPFDRKRFSPHITLVRRVVCGAAGMPGVVVSPAGMTVDHIALMRSDRGADGMIYTELE